MTEFWWFGQRTDNDEIQRFWLRQNDDSWVLRQNDALKDKCGDSSLRSE
jgi:hypothetical protein